MSMFHTNPNKCSVPLFSPFGGPHINDFWSNHQTISHNLTSEWSAFVRLIGKPAWRDSQVTCTYDWSVFGRFTGKPPWRDFGFVRVFSVYNPHLRIINTAPPRFRRWLSLSLATHTYTRGAMNFIIAQVPCESAMLHHVVYIFWCFGMDRFA